MPLPEHFTAWLAAEGPKGASLLLVTEVRFTPSELGEIRGLLVLTSPDGGEYKASWRSHFSVSDRAAWRLRGFADGLRAAPAATGTCRCPQGRPCGRTLGICPSRLVDADMIDSREGKPTNVEFQNPFAEPVEFSLQAP